MGKKHLPVRLFSYSVYFFALSAPISIVAAQIAAGLVLVFGLIGLFTGARRSDPPLASSVFLFSFIAVFLLSIILSPVFDETIPQIRKSWVLLCYLPLVMFPSAYSVRKTVEFLIWGGVAASVIAVFRVLIGEVGRAAPYSGGYTTLALFEAALIPAALAFAVGCKSSKRWLYIGAALAMFAGLVLSQTRAGWLACGLGVLIFGSFIDWKKTIAGIIVALAVLAMIPQTRNIILSRFESDRRGGITSGRSSIYKAAREPLAQLPFFGHGPGSFNRLVPDSVLEEAGDTGVRSWHSMPLEILMESGPLALAVFIGFAFMPLKSCWEKRKIVSGGIMISGALFSSLMALYFAGLTTNPARDFLLLSLLTIFWSIGLIYNETGLEATSG